MQVVVIVTEGERRLGPVVWLSVERFVQSPDIVGQGCRVLFAVYSLFWFKSTELCQLRPSLPSRLRNAGSEREREREREREK